MAKCPACGKPATGKFCGNCGSALAGAACRSCGAAVKPADRFCHKCGAATAGPVVSKATLPWVIAGAALVLVVLVVIVRFTGAGQVASPPPVAATGAPGAGMVDLSQMSPREAADRLFNRIMTAHEAGNADQVSFFLPMGVQSYQALGDLDADAQYHLGLIQAVGGRVDEALARADSLARVAPGHLFVSMLRATASSMKGDSATLRQAYRDFLDHYEAEVASGKGEYSEHQRAIADFRTEATNGSGR